MAYSFLFSVGRRYLTTCYRVDRTVVIVYSSVSAGKWDSTHWINCSGFTTLIPILSQRILQM